MSPARPALCVFVKEPRPGLVKTRLVLALGVEGAAALALAFCDDVLARVARLDAEGRFTAIVALDGDASGLPASAAGLPVWPQGDGDLGVRLERILSRALREAPSVLVIGTDAPDLPERLLDEAVAALALHDAVIVPAHDGGFCLLGLRLCPDGLLADLPWSSPDTCERTLERLRTRKLDVAVLEPWFDIDTPEDLEPLRERLVADPGAAPATLSALTRSCPV